MKIETKGFKRISQARFKSWGHVEQGQPVVALGNDPRSRRMKSKSRDAEVKPEMLTLDKASIQELESHAGLSIIQE